MKLRTTANRRRYASREERRSLLATPDVAEPYAALADQSIGLEAWQPYSTASQRISAAFREVIRPGAFQAVLDAKPDVALLYNHDWNAILARTRTGSLRVYEDGAGLNVRAQLDPVDQDVQRVAPKVRRGVVSGMSFAFRSKRDEWKKTRDDSSEASSVSPSCRRSP